MSPGVLYDGVEPIYTGAAQRNPFTETLMKRGL